MKEVNVAECCPTLRSILWFIKMPIIFVHLPPALGSPGLQFLQGAPTVTDSAWTARPSVDGRTGWWD